MERIVCNSENGYSIEIGKGFPYFLEEITGIHEMSGSVATVKSAFGIGSKYMGTSVDDRAITITGHFKSRLQARVPQRDTLYKAFSLDKKGTLFYYEDNKSFKIDYYVKKVQTSNSFGYDSFQIELYCPSPYFTDLEETVVSLANWKKLFSFPLEIIDGQGVLFGEKEQNTLATILNNSNIEIGMRIIFNAEDTVVNPKITNVITNEELSLDVTLERGEQIEVSTYINDKNIYLIKDGVKTRKNNLLKFGSTFLQIHQGTNTFKFDTDSGSEDLSIEFYYYNNYEAV